MILVEKPHQDGVLNRRVWASRLHLSRVRPFVSKSSPQPIAAAEPTHRSVPHEGHISSHLSPERPQRDDRFARFRDLTDRFASNVELVVMMGVLAGLCWWFVAAGMTPPTDEPVRIQSNIETPAAVDRFAFAGRNGLASQMRIPGPQPVHRDLILQARSLALDVHHVSATHADPLAVVSISGLPSATRMSVGGFHTPTTWSAAIGDLDNLIITLPADASLPIRTRIDVRGRAGEVLHSFALELQLEGPADAKRPAPRAGVISPNEGEALQNQRSQSKRKSRQSSAARAQPAIGSAAPTIAATGAKAAPQLVWPGTPANVGKPSLSSPPPALLPNGAAATGLFVPDPRDSALSGLAPAERDDPRHLILRGLDPGPGRP